jgi:pyruvate dehydrogenase E2 component (dihydrolipoamide acetyltransferase)
MGFKEIPLSGMRKIIAERMKLSVSTAAQYTENMDVDVTELVRLREGIKEDFEKKAGLKLTYTPFFVMFSSLALKDFPILNSTLEQNVIKMFDEVNIGVAFALKDGLIVPVIKNVEGKSLTDIVTELDIFSKKVNQGNLSLDDVSNGTFTITNIGMYGVDNFTPIVNIPQVAILGVNRIVKKPIVIEEKIVIRDIMTLSLTSDHRVVDGVIAAQFLKKMSFYIQSKETLSEVLKF